MSMILDALRKMEQERKLRELAKTQAPQASGGGISRDRGHSHGSSRRRGSFVFYLKNATVYMPLNTAWMKFRSGMPTASRSVSGVAGTGDPRLSTLELRIGDADRLPQALQQVRNVLMSTHKGIEDFSFRTQEEWAEQIDTFVHNARLSGGLGRGGHRPGSRSFAPHRSSMRPKRHTASAIAQRPSFSGSRVAMSMTVAVAEGPE